MCVQQIPVGETSPDFNQCTAAAAAAAVAATAAATATASTAAAAAVFLVFTSSSAHLPIAIHLIPVNI